jgi:AcrR family transcriptional regulator
VSVPAKDRRKAVLGAVQREQILDGFAAAIAAKGYQATTIADIAAAAHVSKTTFYEHFADKEAVFLALHAKVAAAIFAALDLRLRATAGDPDWRNRIRQMTAGYLDAMAANPAFLLQVMTEAAVTSPKSRAARDAALDRFAELMTGVVHELAATSPELQPLPHDLALATLAGILELVSRAAGQGPDAVRALAGSVGELVARVLAPAPPGRQGKTSRRGLKRPPTGRR